MAGTDIGLFRARHGGHPTGTIERAQQSLNAAVRETLRRRVGQRSVDIAEVPEELVVAGVDHRHEAADRYAGDGLSARQPPMKYMGCDWFREFVFDCLFMWVVAV